MNAEATSPHGNASRGTFWALLPVGLLGSCLVGLGIMASIATRDPGFALERDYYARAVDFESEQAQRRTNAELGYRISLDVSDAHELRASLLAADGRPLPGAKLRAEAFANARAAARRELAFEESVDGAYVAELGPARSGLWEFRFTAEVSGRRFTQIVRRDVPGAKATP